MKKTICIFIALVLAVGVLPLFTFAEAEEPTVTLDGMRVTINGLYDIKDLFISRGIHSAYRPCADNKVVRATGEKLAGGHSWSYILPEPGDYTLCVRYNDATQKFVHFTAYAAIPEFFTDGLEVTITNLTGAKVVRMAKGSYATPGEVKRGENAKGFTPKTFNYADEYTFRFAEEGQYTIVVQYENCYTHLEHVTLTKKTPTFTVNGDVLTISGLDGLYVIRYAEGEFAAIRDIKYTTGSKVIRPAQVTDGSVTVPGLHGQYTFAVQYTDGTVYVETLVIGETAENQLERYGLTVTAEAYADRMPQLVPYPGYHVDNRHYVTITVESAGGGSVPDMTVIGDVITQSGTVYGVWFGLSDEAAGRKVFTTSRGDLYGIVFENDEVISIDLQIRIGGDVVSLTVYATAMVVW